MPGNVVAFNIPIPGLSALNPFNWLAGAWHSMLLQEITVFEKAIISPPAQPAYSTTAYIYGNALGLAGRLSVIVTVAIAAIMVIHHRSAMKFPKALISLAIIGVGGPAFFYIVDQLVSFGTTFASALMVFNGGAKLLNVPSSAGIIQEIMSYASIWGFGTLLVGEFFAYSIVIVVVKVLFLPALALWALGDRGRRFLNWIISLGLVATVFGRVVAVLILVIGRVFYVTFTNLGWGWMGQTFVLCTTMLIAFLSQFVLIYVTLNAVDRVTGSLDSRVTGSVRSTLVASGMNPANLPAANAATNSSGRVSMRSSRDGAGTLIKDAGIATVAIGAATLIGPEAGAVGKTLQRALHKHATQRGHPPPNRV
jgi:hypothetical protein